MFTKRLIPALALVAVVALLSSWHMRRVSSMRTTLYALQADNQADSVFRSDSLQRRLVRFFDRQALTPLGLLHPSRTANDRLLAHYLLGRALADMGDAPAAVEEYKDAISCADTTIAQCNYDVLRGVYGQLATIFCDQNLPDAQLSALRHYERCAWILGDTIEAISAYARNMDAYYLKGDTDSVLSVTTEMARRFESIGASDMATQFLGSALSIYVYREQFDSAIVILNKVKAVKANFRDVNTPAAGRELYYYIMGCCYEASNDIDSAEYCYRQALAHGKIEAGSRGLLSLYNTLGNVDSIRKYSRLYCDANDYSHDELRTSEVERILGLYDYTEQQKLAHKRADEVSTLIIFLVILILLVFVLLVRIRQQRNRRLADISQLRSELSVAQLKREKAESELLRISEGNSDSCEQKEAAIAYKRHQVKNYREQEETLFRQLEASSIKDFLSSLTNDSRVKRLKELAHFSCHSEDVTEQDWINLLDACKPRLNPFLQFINSAQGLTSRDVHACLLILLDFSNSELLVLFRLSTRQAVNEIKKKINSHLFQDASARSLRANLLSLAAKNADSTAI